jgi:hypothetical protein
VDSVISCFTNSRTKYLQCLQKWFTPLEFFQMLLCYSQTLKWIPLRLVTGLHTIPHNVQVEMCFYFIFNFHKLIWKWTTEMSWVNKYSTPLLWRA